MIYLLHNKETGEPLSAWHYIYEEGSDDLFYFVEPKEINIKKSRINFETEEGSYRLPNNYWMIKDPTGWYIVPPSYINRITDWNQVRKQKSIW